MPLSIRNHNPVLNDMKVQTKQILQQEYCRLMLPTMQWDERSISFLWIASRLMENEGTMLRKNSRRNRQPQADHRTPADLLGLLKHRCCVKKSTPPKPIKLLLQSSIDRNLSFFLPSHFLQGCCYLQGGHFAPVTQYSLANPALASAMNL